MITHYIVVKMYSLILWLHLANIFVFIKGHSFDFELTSLNQYAVTALVTKHSCKGSVTLSRRFVSSGTSFLLFLY